MSSNFAALRVLAAEMSLAPVHRAICRTCGVPLEWTPRSGGRAPVFCDAHRKAGVRAYKTAKQREYEAKKLAELKAAGKKPCNGPLCNGAMKPFGDFESDPSKALGVRGQCRACRNHLSLLRYHANPGRPKELRTARRLQAVAIYGGQCDGCAQTDGLEFDHIDNDGAEHRKTEEVAAMIDRIVRTGRPIEDYRLRLLCGPCHRTISSRTGKVSRAHVGLMFALSSDWPVFTL